MWCPPPERSGEGGPRGMSLMSIFLCQRDLKLQPLLKETILSVKVSIRLRGQSYSATYKNDSINII
jgi:hypothetical protein